VQTHGYVIDKKDEPFEKVLPKAEIIGRIKQKLTGSISLRWCGLSAMCDSEKTGALLDSPK
jgi:hypothetical protein